LGKFLYNRVNKEELRVRLLADSTPRTTLSFYKYVIFNDPKAMRDQLFKSWDELGVLGRIYIAYEGINAQMSVPTEKLELWKNSLQEIPELKDVPVKIAVEDDGKSFFKLAIKVRKKIVADGLADNTFDVTNVGNHLTAEEFNAALESENTVVVDMRNHYESEVGRFEGAICPDVDTFKEELPWVAEQLKDKKDKKILMYCTGGIRCEKASAYMKHMGFEDVNQLYGGIISYAQEIKEKGLNSKFKGKNFVFDERLGERITTDILSNCHQCGAACDNHTNCANVECNLLFIQCDACKAEFNNCCSNECKEIIAQPVEVQKVQRKGKINPYSSMLYRKGRLRPNGKELQTNLKENQ